MSNSETPAKKVPHLLAKSFKEAEYTFPNYFAELPVGTPIEALKDPAYWANVAQRMNVPGIVHAMPADGAYYARFMIRSKGPNWAHVALIEHVPFASAESVVAKAKNFDISWSGPSSKFRVTRTTDKEVLKSGFATKEEAAEWVAANAQAVGA